MIEQVGGNTVEGSSPSWRKCNSLAGTGQQVVYTSLYLPLSTLYSIPYRIPTDRREMVISYNTGML